MVKISFRKKFHLASSRPKNPDADSLFLAIRDEYEAYIESNDPSTPVMKMVRKSLKGLQKGLVDLPVASKLELKLNGAILGEPGAFVVSKALSESKALRMISLVKCGLDSPSMQAFGRLISTLPQLEELNLSGNSLQNAGLIALLSGINLASPIPVIKLAGAGFTDDAVNPLLNLLTATRTNLSLDLSKNTFSISAVDQLIQGANKNVFVIGLNLEGSGISDDQSKQLYEILARNELVAGVIDRLLVNSCRRNFKTRLVLFRESVHANRVADDANIENTGPVYKWIQKSKSMLSAATDVQSQRFFAGTCLDIGRRNEMQDVICIKGVFRGDKNQDLFALFDGHGGREAATYCAERLPLIIAENLDKRSNDPAASIKEAFQKCHKEMSAWSTITGTTAVIVLIIDNKRYVINLGDSKAVLCQRGMAIFSTKDHKATDPNEQQRILGLGGQVINGRVNGQLSVARALGDSNLSPYVIPHPDVYEQVVSKYDEFMVLASDGIWDVLTPDDVVKLVVNHQKRTSFKEADSTDAKVIAELIKDAAYNKGSNDNMSVVVIIFSGYGKLKHRRKKSDISILSTSESVDSKLCELDPLYVASDSELNTLKDDDDDSGEERAVNSKSTPGALQTSNSSSSVVSTKGGVPGKKLTARKPSFDDSVLDQMKAQNSYKTLTPLSSRIDEKD